VPPGWTKCAQQTCSPKATQAQTRDNESSTSAANASCKSSSSNCSETQALADNVSSAPHQAADAFAFTVTHTAEHRDTDRATKNQEPWQEIWDHDGENVPSQGGRGEQDAIQQDIRRKLEWTVLILLLLLVVFSTVSMLSRWHLLHESTPRPEWPLAESQKIGNEDVGMRMGDVQNPLDNPYSLGDTSALFSALFLGSGHMIS